jgi:hypothetical protein
MVFYRGFKSKMASHTHILLKELQQRHKDQVQNRQNIIQVPRHSSKGVQCFSKWSLTPSEHCEIAVYINNSTKLSSAWEADSRWSGQQLGLLLLLLNPKIH